MGFICNSFGRLRLSAQATPKHQAPQPRVPPSIAGIWTMEIGFERGSHTRPNQMIPMPIIEVAAINPRLSFALSSGDSDFIIGSKPS